MTDHSGRKLSAILAADVAGYSRLMGADEEGTLASLTAHRRELFDPALAKHRGRIVKTTGDGLLAEFGSVVDAVRCAVEVQAGMAERNAGSDADRRLDFRIGINVGDIVEQDGDIFGDGVNIAARLEGIADPGGICISARVYEDVAGKIAAIFEDIGEQNLKNIARSIRVFRVTRGDGTQTPPSPARVSPLSRLPDRPAIAVLPFQNMSGDAEQEYFADGIVEDIITALSRFKAFGVVARNSSFVYKGRAVDIRQVAKELGVRYVLEGSVRRAGQRLRITAQLIDAASGSHLWAKNFDGSVDDVFAFQDSITESVVSIVEPMVKRSEIERARQKPAASLDAYDLYLQALAIVLATNPGSNARAIDLIERSLALDPDFGPAMAIAASAQIARFDRQQAGASDAERIKGLNYARAALASAGTDANTRAIAGLGVIVLGKEYDSGLAAVRQAVADNPNSVNVLGYAGIGALRAGSLEEAEQYLQRAIRLNPDDFVGHWSFTAMAAIRMAQGRFEEACEWATRAHATDPQNEITHWMLIAANAHLGRLVEARRWREALQALAPGSNIASIALGQHTKDPQRIDVVIEGLRIAGLPET